MPEEIPDPDAGKPSGANPVNNRDTIGIWQTPYR
jgi:hypothetical protein